jgi:hypothetical protein
MDVTTTGLSSGIKLLFSFYQSTKPEQIQPVWEVSDTEVLSIAGPAVKCIDMLPIDLVDNINKWSAPVSLLIATVVVIGQRVYLERELRKHYGIGSEQTETNNTVSSNKNDRIIPTANIYTDSAPFNPFPVG